MDASAKRHLSVEHLVNISSVFLGFFFLPSCDQYITFSLERSNMQVYPAKLQFAPLPPEVGL